MRYCALSQLDTSGLEADHPFATRVEQTCIKKRSFVTRHPTTELAQEVSLSAHLKILKHITIHVARKATEKSSWPKKFQRSLVIYLEGNRQC
jgi:hypothetical protein